MISATRSTSLAVAIAVFLSSGLAAQTTAPVSTPLLNSERIVQEFGSYGIEVLEADANVRVSNLYSLQSGTRICRTFAVVRFPEEPAPALAVAHQSVLSGESIGSALSEREWGVRKVNRYFGLLPAGARVVELMGETPHRLLAVHAYDLWAARPAEAYLYATIVEIHHPEYLQLSELREIYGAVSGSASDKGLEAMLALARQKIN